MGEPASAASKAPLGVNGLRYYRPTEYLRRFAWILVQPLFRFSPRHLPGWRNFLLRLFGATVGPGVMIYPSVRITFPWNLRIGAKSLISWNTQVYNLGPLEIGERVIVSQNVHLCGGSHDFETAGFPLVKAPIVIGDDVWIAADAFVGPHVEIGRGSVVGARSVVVRKVEPQTVVAGNPARPLKPRRLQKQF